MIKLLSVSRQQMDSSTNRFETETGLVRTNKPNGPTNGRKGKKCLWSTRFVLISTLVNAPFHCKFDPYLTNPSQLYVSLVSNPEIERRI